jgi:hypothetical protein
MTKGPAPLSADPGLTSGVSVYSCVWRDILS